jgi:hypothetical protein
VGSDNSSVGATDPLKAPPEEVDMGRCAILLIAPVIIGVLIAAGVVVIDRVRQRLGHMNARRTLLEERRRDRALSPVDLHAAKQSADLTHRRIAS